MLHQDIHPAPVRRGVDRRQLDLTGEPKSPRCRRIGHSAVCGHDRMNGANLRRDDLAMVPPRSDSSGIASPHMRASAFDQISAAMTTRSQEICETLVFTAIRRPFSNTNPVALARERSAPRSMATLMIRATYDPGSMQWAPSSTRRPSPYRFASRGSRSASSALSSSRQETPVIRRSFYPRASASSALRSA